VGKTSSYKELALGFLLGTLLVCVEGLAIAGYMVVRVNIETKHPSAVHAVSPLQDKYNAVFNVEDFHYPSLFFS
jgi:hypothetical protein